MKFSIVSLSLFGLASLAMAAPSEVKDIKARGPGPVMMVGTCTVPNDLEGNGNCITSSETIPCSVNEACEKNGNKCEFLYGATTANCNVTSS